MLNHLLESALLLPLVSDSLVRSADVETRDDFVLSLSSAEVIVEVMRRLTNNGLTFHL